MEEVKKKKKNKLFKYSLGNKILAYGLCAGFYIAILCSVIAILFAAYYNMYFSSELESQINIYEEVASPESNSSSNI